MGFRNPIRTASALDSRNAPGASGVLIQGTSATWADGYGTNASDVLTAPPGGGTGGDVFTRTGPNRFTAGATLALAEEALGNGGYQSTATLHADVLRLQGAGGDGWQSLTMGAAWAAWDTAGNLPLARRDLAGNVHLSGIAKLTASFSAGGTSTGFTLPAGYAPGGAVQRPVIILNPNGTFGATGWLLIAAGSLSGVLVNTTANLLGAGYGWTLGCTYSP